MHCLRPKSTESGSVLQREDLMVVAAVEDAGQAADTHTRKVDDPRCTQEVDVGRDPAAIVQLPQVIGSLVIAAHCNNHTQQLQNCCVCA